MLDRPPVINKRDINTSLIKHKVALIFFIGLLIALTTVALTVKFTKDSVERNIEDVGVSSSTDDEAIITQSDKTGSKEKVEAGSGQKSISNEAAAQEIYYNPLTGLETESETVSKRRPLAVMISAEPDVRPQSGISEAEMVFEMPAGRGAVTRLMAVYIEKDPVELGSLRSARHDFIELAKGFDAIYAHWGGSAYAYMWYLNKGFIDDLDQIKYPDTYAFHRIVRLYPPDNGFTSAQALRDMADEKNYRQTTEPKSYRFYEEEQIRAIDPIDQIDQGVLNINYLKNYRVSYEYNRDSNTYKRFYGTDPHRDYNNKKQVEVSNVIVVRADWHLLHPRQQYLEVDLDGEGRVEVYQNGSRIIGVWKKETPASQIRFYHGPNKNIEIPLVPGQSWVQIIDTQAAVTWYPGQKIARSYPIDILGNLLYSAGGLIQKATANILSLFTR